MAKLMNSEGVYVSCIIVTKDGEILGDAKENLPSAKLDKISFSDVMHMNENHADFEWLQNFASSFSESISSLKEKVSTFPNKYELRRAVVQGFSSLIDQFGNLGILYDRPIKSYKYNMLQFVTVIELTDKSAVSVNNNYKWYPLADFEHKIYQRYDNLDYIALLEKLDSSFYGERWIHGAIKTFGTLKSRLQAGFYVAHARFCFSKDGTYVLVNDDKRNLVPMELVTTAKVSNESWQWVQSIRNSFVNGKEIVEPKQPFSVQFSKAMQRLKDKLLLGDKSETGCSDALGDIYDVDTMYLDDAAAIKMAVFVDSVPSMTIASKLKGKYVWKRVNLVEVMSCSVYAASIYLQMRKTFHDYLAVGPQNDRYEARY